VPGGRGGGFLIRRGRALVALAAAVALLIAGLSGCTQEPSSSFVTVIAPVPVSAKEFAKLTQATTFTSIPAAPRDSDPFAITDGTVLHPLTAQVVYLEPGEKPVGVLPATELGSPTWVPVVQGIPGWAQVLLPSRPDRSAGWIFTDGSAASQVEIRVSPYLIRIEVGARQLSVYDDGALLGTWTVAVGAPATPTPTGRTFLLALLAPSPVTYSPLILPLGTHSNTFSTFGGGPGTVGLHGWPSPSVFGHAVSNGCVRVPAAALQVLSHIPLGTLVMITP
jgi:lipoprotein-anchoring transpeptidase ErfK/SrfK